MWRAGTNDFTVAETAKRFQTDDTYYASPELFGIFDFPWLAGDPKTGLNKPNTAALTRSIADAWFGDWKQAMGKHIYQGEDKTPFAITGIIDDLPQNTDIPLKVVLSYETFKGFNKDVFTDPKDWDNFSSASQCFFLLPPNVSIASLEKRLPDFVARHYTPLFANSDTRD